MKKVVYISFGVALASLLVLGGVYFYTSRVSPGTSSNGGNVPSSTLNPEYKAQDEPFSQVETSLFVGKHFAFKYPKDWKPVEKSDGTVDLGIPAPGITSDTLGFEKGNYDDVVSSSASMPNLKAEGYNTLVDRKGYSRLTGDDKNETYEFFAPGRTDSEVVVLRVKAQADSIPGVGGYLSDLFQGLTIIK